ncbi:MAG: hypothetical protein JSS57_09450 [Proteobacteria bacterium]|nr:hypothetical protein [Pseudomonadota bacterium]
MTNNPVNRTAEPEPPGATRRRLSALRQARAFSLIALAALCACEKTATGEAQSELRTDVINFEKATGNLPPPIISEKFTELIRNYIPEGTTFSDAEAFLVKAGFKLDTDPYRIPKRAGHHDETHAYLVIQRNFYSTAMAHVYLKPAVPGNFDRIGQVTASITIDLP